MEDTFWEVFQDSTWQKVENTTFIKGNEYRLASKVCINNDTDAGSPSATAGDEYQLLQ